MATAMATTPTATRCAAPSPASSTRIVYDYENRLVEVWQGETLIANFLYAADGSRVKGTVGGVSTVYIAGIYEQSEAASTSYYEGGAMRRSGYAESNGVFYLLQDQLKSTSVIADQAGVEAARQFFFPYGGNRGGAAFSELTTKRFTGQYHEQGLPGSEGMSYYNARWYDPQLGRFTSPDTIVPKPDSPQAINRYSYGYNNPLKYDDPSGHCPRPPDDMGPTICVALFIAPQRIDVPPITLHGDGRSFDSNSDPKASRGYAWIAVTSSKVKTHMNPSIYIFPASIAGHEAYLETEPSKRNTWVVKRSAGGTIDVEYNLVVSGPLDKSGLAPHINGRMTFRPNEKGGYDSLFDRDGFPWAEAYYWNGKGKVQTIFRDPAIRGNPHDLFAIEKNEDVTPQSWFPQFSVFD